MMKVMYCRFIVNLTYSSVHFVLSYYALIICCMRYCLLCPDMAALQEALLEVMPSVEEANSISEELDKRVKFEIMLVSPEIVGGKGKNKTQVRGQLLSMILVSACMKQNV